MKQNQGQATRHRPVPGRRASLRLAAAVAAMLAVPLATEGATAADGSGVHGAAGRVLGTATGPGLGAAAAASGGTLRARGSNNSGQLGPAGSVHQVNGKDGCYTTDGSSAAGPGTCRKIRGGNGSTSLAVSPDGRSAYLVGYGTSNSPGGVPVLSVFRRDPRTGILRQLAGTKGCFSTDGLSPDGPNTCTDARNLDTGDATSLTISGNGRFVYVASQYTPAPTHEVGGIAIFRRDVMTGALSQLRGKLGCISATGESEDGPSTCARAREVDSVSNVHLTPDQKYLYASVYDGQPHSGIAIFGRDSTNGTLRQLRGKDGCVTDNGTTAQSGTSVVCRAMPNLGVPWDVATPDNRFAYVPDKVNNLVQGFRRNSAGGLVPLAGRGGCVSDTGSSPLGPGTCVHGRGLFDVERAVLSTDSRFIYTNGFTQPSPVAVLDRNPRTGMLSQRPGPAACVSQNGTSGDTTDTCRDGRALNSGYAGALAPDGRTLYFAEFGTNGARAGLVIFRVSLRTGGFSQLAGTLGCVTADGSSEDGAGTCATARAIGGAYQVAIASGGRDVYLSAYFGDGVALFHAVR
jgi:hypothetical protein